MVFSSIVQQHLECQRERRLDLNAPLMSVRRQQNNNTSVSGDEHHHRDRRSNANDQAYHRIQVFHEKRAPGYGDQDQGEKVSWESLRSPGAVPFVWERTPGRPKSGHIETRRLAASACSSPALPPGRATMTWAYSPANAPLSTQANSVADLKANNRRRRRKRAAPRGHRQASLGELLARKRKGIGAGSSSSASASASSDSETEVVSESSEEEQSENFMAPDPPPPPVARSAAKPAFDDPAARDFILKRFLPAAKAMADESSSSPPYSSPLLSSNPNAQQKKNSRPPNPGNPSASSPSSSSPRNQVSASVERIQTYQYKFASGKKPDSESAASGDDVFSLKACGFFSLNLLRHLRPQYPSSRLKRAGNRANNRFAEEEDDFRTSMLVKRVNGDLTIKHEGEFSEPETEDDPGHQQLHHQQHQVRKNQGKSPRKSPELFYDCDTNFEPAVEPRFNPRTPGRSYYRGSVSPLVESTSEKTRGFLGLPENYKPPDDPYRSGGYSPSIHQKERNSTSLSMMSARNQSSLAQRVARNAWVNNNTEGSSSPSSDSRNGVANLSWNSSSYCSIGEGSESNHHHQHHRVWQEKKPEVLQSPARAKLPAPASPVSSLLPPKSPSQSWLWKALPLASPVESKETNANANWETTVKSRQLRPDHLRYSEENALESCQYYP